MRRGWNLFVQFLKLLWSVGMLAAIAPFWLFMKAVEVIRVGLGLVIIIIVLGLFWESGLIQGLWQGEESVRATTRRAGGEAHRDRGRARQEALDGRAAPRRGWGRRPETARQSKEDRRREAAAAQRARARYQVEQRRLLEERVLGQRREKGNI